MSAYQRLAREMLELAIRDAVGGSRQAREWLSGQRKGRLSVETCLELLGLNIDPEDLVARLRYIHVGRYRKIKRKRLCSI